MRNKVLLQCFYIYCQVLSWLIISCGHYEAGNNPVKLEALIPAVRATEGAPRRGSDRIPHNSRLAEQGKSPTRCGPIPRYIQARASSSVVYI